MTRYLTHLRHSGPRRSRLRQATRLLLRYLGPDEDRRRRRHLVPGRRGLPRAVRDPAGQGRREAARPRLLRCRNARQRRRARRATPRRRRAAHRRAGRPGHPGGGYGFRFFDVDGRTIEVSADVAARTHRRVEERESVPVRLSGRLLRAGVRKIWGPGRHLAGNNTFSYFLDPHGNTVEYTTELEHLDEDTWHPHVYDFSQPEVTDQWGTANPMSELIAKESFNDVDPGVFVAPPV